MKVAFIEPENPGNIGALARVMANFDFYDLILVNPQCDPFSEEARMFAKHAFHIIENAMILKSWDQLRKKFDYLIATTAKETSKYSPIFEAVPPEEIPRKGVVVFGREGIGLKNEEIAQCDLVVRIPASRRYRTLNITHAAAIILYVLFRKGVSEEEIVGREKIEVLVEKMLERKEVYHRDYVKQSLMRVFQKARLKKDEWGMLMKLIMP